MFQIGPEAPKASPGTTTKKILEIVELKQKMIKFSSLNAFGAKKKKKAFLQLNMVCQRELDKRTINYA